MLVPSRSASPKPQEVERNKKGKLLKEQLELEKYKTPDGRTRLTIKPIEDNLSFDKGFYVFVRALQMLKSQNEGAIMVGLAGPSGAGKTAFSEKIKNFMPGVAVISMDMYNDGSKVVDQNFDDPRLTDYDTLLRNLSDLRSGHAAQIPIYDFRQSKRVGYNTQEVPSSRVVIIEGIYALSEKLRPMLDLKVSVQGGIHFDLVKRVMRDVHRSGQQPDEIIQQITDTVFPMFKAFIEPDLKTAQIRIINSFNPFAGFMAPTYILKSRNVPSEQQVIEALGGKVSQKRDVDIHDIYLLPPNEDPETCVTWLRMRNRDGRYSLMFEEWVTEGNFIISPRIAFEVNVRILGGLMALGYEIGTIMKRTSTTLLSEDESITIKLDDIPSLGNFVQILGKERDAVAAVGAKLGLEGTYIPRSYIEQVQLEQLTSEFCQVTAAFKQHVASSLGSQGWLEELTATVGLSPERASDPGGSAGLLMRSNSMPLHAGTGAGAGAGRGQYNGGAGGPNGNAEGRAMPPAGNGSGSSVSMRRAPGLGLQPVAERSSDSLADLGLEASMSMMTRQLDCVASHVEGYGAMQVQLDAMVEQYKVMNEHLRELSSHTTALAGSLVSMRLELAASAPAGGAQQQQQQQQAPSSSASSAAGQAGPVPGGTSLPAGAGLPITPAPSLLDGPAPGPALAAALADLASAPAPALVPQALVPGQFSIAGLGPAGSLLLLSGAASVGAAAGVVVASLLMRQWGK